MKRVQIYLENEQYSRLQRLGSGKNMAKHIREAIDIVFPEKSEESLTDILREVSGIWEGREEITISRSGKKRRGYINSLVEE